jgi:hypothetical protein
MIDELNGCHYANEYFYPSLSWQEQHNKQHRTEHVKIVSEYNKMFLG